MYWWPDINLSFQKSSSQNCCVIVKYPYVNNDNDYSGRDTIYELAFLTLKLTHHLKYVLYLSQYITNLMHKNFVSQ